MINQLSCKNFILPTDLVLDFSEETKTRILRDPRLSSLNQISLETFLPYLQEEFPQARLQESDSRILGFVNGFAINLDNKRLILVPSDAIETDVLEIPQEWVDLPSWRGDYYLAVQVDLDENFLRVWGYSTHKTIKEKAEYGQSDRNYLLEDIDLIDDLNVLWIAREFCPDEVTQTEIANIPIIGENQAEILINQLKSVPRAQWRTFLPFTQWGALLENSRYRERLQNDRILEQWSLRQWLETGISEIAQQIGWSLRQLEPSLAVTRGDESTASIIFSRRLTIAGQPYELQIQPQQSEQGIWRFSLQNLTIGGLIPGGFKLRLLTDTDEPFPGNESIASSAVETLSLTIQLDPGDGLIWEIEPRPDNYQPEILRF